MRAGQPAKLRELGYDEIWLQNWLAGDPTRLGLGEVRIVAQELTAPRGGSLDILAADGDTYYSVEVQLGEVDASHSFRVFDYWARNRMRFEGKTHVAVLVVESATGRYRPALEALAEYLPLVVIELRAWRGEAEVILVPETVVINQNLDVAGPAGTVSGEARSEADWKASISPEAWAFHDEFIAWTWANLGEIRVDYSPKSYVGIRRGRRVWAPLWFRRDGATIYLPDPDGLRAVARRWPAAAQVRPTYPQSQAARTQARGGRHLVRGRPRRTGAVPHAGSLPAPRAGTDPWAARSGRTG